VSKRGIAVTIKTTIYLDEKLLERVRRFVAPRDLSRLVSELLDERVRQLEQVEIETAMRNGYLATNGERRELNADWQVVDGEGWPA
jgi:hypothetical protein